MSIVLQLKEKRKVKLAAFDASIKNAVKDARDITATGIGKVKAEFEKIGTSVTGGIHDGKANRIKRNIARHEAKLKSLQHDLKTLA